MERKIGEIFTCDGKTYQVVKGITCDDCCILHDHCFSIKNHNILFGVSDLVVSIVFLTKVMNIF